MRASPSIPRLGGVLAEPALRVDRGLAARPGGAAHHWLDSTHITYGVVTAGYIWNNIKFESSAFKGREPDENRWDIETPKLDSYSARVSINPHANWALQASYGKLAGPEQLRPDEDVGRTTVSAIYNKAYASSNWQTTVAWGRNTTAGEDLDGFLIESTLNVNKTNVFFARGEQVRKNELFLPDDPRADEAFPVSRLEAGYIYYLPVIKDVRLGIGASATFNFPPDDLRAVYGDMPQAYLVFTSLRLRN
jgi:hypothetical protein